MKMSKFFKTFFPILLDPWGVSSAHTEHVNVSDDHS